ncbi:aspartic proteinase-like protein 2 isoform 2 [Planoprotostelium fungivorum]|uniref:Aspartic proteinase-like protein 2 isoform 2 n=1 Tax=Planoprotostelium fungivorum TaxID=1890364 RepID=A0A2P6N5B4_9EUKA|nr:aspartic proteinase-like protein 2 isoform 2 [Planoprotostelium fungivorum]
MKVIAALLLFVALAAAATHSISMGRKTSPGVVFGESKEAFSAGTDFYLSTKWGHLQTNNRKRANNIIMGGNINPLGIFYVNMSVGRPAQEVSVAVDSGSFTMLVPGPNCDGCPTAPAKYNPKLSTTVSQYQCSDACQFCSDSNICAWSNTYQTCNLSDTTQTCTVSGLVFVDYFELGSLKSQGTTRFGVIDTQTKNFQQLYVIDGILGFSLGTTFGQKAQIYQLADEGQISNKFGMCFDVDGQGGLLTLGEPDSKLYKGELKNIPLIPNEAFVIELDDVKIGGVSIGLPESSYQDVPAGGCIVDSGTNILLFPDDVFNAVKQTFLNKCNKAKLHGVCDVDEGKTFFDTQCYSLTPRQLKSFPNIELDFGGIPMVLPPSSYLLPKVGDPSQRCLGIQNTGEGGLLIIGDTTMQQYYTVFDLENNFLSIAPLNKQNCKA